MMQENVLILETIDIIKSGDIERGKKILEEYLLRNPGNKTAEQWLRKCTNGSKIKIKPNHSE